MAAFQERRKTETEFATPDTKMAAAEQYLMKQMCPFLISPAVFGEVTPQMNLLDEVIGRFDLKGASNFMIAETAFHSEPRLWTKSSN